MKSKFLKFFLVFIAVAVGGFFALKNTGHSSVSDEMFEALFAKGHDGIFKMSVQPRVGFGWSRKYNEMNANKYHPDSGGPVRPFFQSAEKYLNVFLPHFSSVTGIGVVLVTPADEVASGRDDVNIRIVADGSFTHDVDGRRVYRGDQNTLIEDDVFYRDDVVRIEMQSPVRAYAYFDENHQIKHVVCHMWVYMGRAERRAALHECVVKAVGIMDGLNKLSYFQTPIVHRDVRKLIKFLYCPEVKSGMSRKDLQEITRQKKCL